MTTGKDKTWRSQCPPELFDGHAVLMEMREMFPKRDPLGIDVSDILDAVVSLIKKRVKRETHK